MESPSSIQENLRAAISNGRTDILRVILTTIQQDHGLAVNTSGPDKSRTSERNGDSNAFLNEILNKPCYSNGNTLLHYGTEIDQADAVRTLLLSGADISVKNQANQTPLDLMQSTKMRSVYIESLLKATAQSNVGQVAMLLDAGLEVNEADCEESGNTALHWAACFANMETACFLLEKGADPNKSNSFGATPLHEAIHRGDADIIQRLLIHGANPNLAAAKGKFANKTAIDLAISKPDILSLLVNYRKRSLESAVVVNGGAENNTSMLSMRKPTFISESSNSLSESDFDYSAVSFSPSTPNFPDKDHKNLNNDSDEKPKLNGFANYAHKLERAESSLSEESLSNTLQPVGSDFSEMKDVFPFEFLCPQPQSVEYLPNAPYRFPINNVFSVFIVQPHHGCADVNEVMDQWETFRPVFKKLGFDFELAKVLPADLISKQMGIICYINRSLFVAAESYAFSILTDQIKLNASCLSGLHHGINTLLQVLRIWKCDENCTVLPAMQIDDYPLIAYRGVLVDLSHGHRIPKLNNFKKNVDLYSSLKLNQLHVFVQFSTESGWKLPYCASALLDFNSYCKKRRMTIVPVLEISPKVSYEQIEELCCVMQEFLCYFSPLNMIHFGPRLSALLVDPASESGSSLVIELWNQLNLPSSATLMLWANSFHFESAGLLHLPPNFILLECGFQRTYDFAGPLKRIKQIGQPTGVCPGTMSWNSIGVNWDCIGHIENAASNAHKNRCLAFILADWSGSSFKTSSTFSWPAVVASAALSWNKMLNLSGSNMGAVLSYHIFNDDLRTIGDLIVDLGMMEANSEVVASEPIKSHKGNEIIPVGLFNKTADQGSLFYRLIVDPDNVDLDCVRPDIFYKALRRMKQHQASIFVVQDVDLKLELELCIQLLWLAHRLGKVLINAGQKPESGITGLTVINLGISNLPSTTKTDTGNKVLDIMKLFDECWSRFNEGNEFRTKAKSQLLNLFHKLIPNDYKPHGDTVTV